MCTSTPSSQTICTGPCAWLSEAAKAGVRLRSVTLIASQPWPVGRGGSCELMLACKVRFSPQRNEEAVQQRIG